MRSPCRAEQIQVEITSDCNLTCPFCARSYVLGDRPHVSMEFEEFRSVFQRDFPEYHTTIFSGFSETLLNEEVWRMAEFEKSRGNSVLVATNGLILDQSRIERLVTIGVDSVTVTIDTLDPARYARLRGSRDLPAILENVRALADTIRRTGEKTRVIVNFVVMRSTMNEVERVLDFMHEARLGVLYLIKMMQSVPVSSRFYDREGFSWEEHESLDYRRIGEIAASYGVKVERSDRRVLVENGCRLPYEGVYIDSSWNVYCCPFLAGLPERLLGNLREAPFAHIVASDRLARLRAVFDRRSHLPECGDCACMFSTV